MRTSLLFLGFVAVLIAGCAGQPPRHAMIEQAYFKCGKCKSVEGGIYGKGPFMKLHAEEAPKCVHRWQRISRDEFKELAEQWHDVDWSTAIPYWQ